MENLPSVLRFFPYGTSPSLINAWKPLQIPSASPSRSSKSFSTASLIFAFWNAVAKNLAEPSGSSPALKPPGNMIICAPEIAFSNSSTESRIPAASRFLNTFVMTFAPARSNARRLSYSQFVPGNTGINTVGCPTATVDMDFEALYTSPIYRHCPLLIL